MKRHYNSNKAKQIVMCATLLVFILKGILKNDPKANIFDRVLNLDKNELCIFKFLLFSTLGPRSKSSKKFSQALKFLNEAAHTGQSPSENQPFYIETDNKKSTQTFYFIAFLILRIILLPIHIPKEHTLRIPKW